MKYLKHILIALTLLSFVFIATDYREEKAETARIQEDHRLELLDQKLQIETIQKRLTAAIIGNSALREEILGASNAIPTAIALFEDQLSSRMLDTATEFTMVSGTYNGGASTLASSTYAFIVNEGTADEEMIIADCTATACTGAIRGIDRLTGNTEVSSLKHTHRRGASIKITDGPQLLILSRIINGDENFPNALTFDGKLTYSSAPSFTNNLDIVSKTYADNIANQGAATSSETVAGIAELATATEAASSTDLGATRPLVLQAKYATTSPEVTTSPLIVMAEVGGKIKQAWLDLTADWTFSGLFTVTGTTTLATTTIDNLTVTNEIYNDTNIISLTASTTMTGATLPQPVYVATSTNADAGGILLCDANAPSTLDFMGFVISNSATGTSAYVQTGGIVDGFSGLSKGDKYYVQDTVGTIATSTGTYEVLVGIAISATEILIQKGSWEYMGTGTDATGAKYAIINITYYKTSHSSDVYKNQLTLCKKGVTSGVVQFGFATANDGIANASWSGDTITVSAGTDTTVFSTIYLYR